MVRHPTVRRSRLKRSTHEEKGRDPRGRYGFVSEPDRTRRPGLSLVLAPRRPHKNGDRLRVFALLVPILVRAQGQRFGHRQGGSSSRRSRKPCGTASRVTTTSMRPALIRRRRVTRASGVGQRSSGLMGGSHPGVPTAMEKKQRTSSGTQDLVASMRVDSYGREAGQATTDH